MNPETQAPSPRRANPFMGILWGILIVLFLNGFIFPLFSPGRITTTDYGTFIERVDSGLVKEVMIKNGRIYYTTDRDGRNMTCQTGAVEDPGLVDRLLEAASPNENGKIAFTQVVPQENSPMLNLLLMWILPGLLIYMLWKQASRSFQTRTGSGGNFLSFGNSGARIYADSDVKTTFADVAGQDEAKEALTEIVDFLHSPSKYAEIGASLPKGALLVGPPGTGKTLNQLLTEMDGFDGRKGVVILAATNRPDSLDKALLRPGRFDRRIQMELPDLEGRKAILQVHLSKVKHESIDLTLVAQATAGSSGAELANIVNEAALRAVRQGRRKVTTTDLEESVETVMAGAQKKHSVLSSEQKRIVACHEIGHALVAAMQTASAPVHKITIIPRTSGALGYTMQVDEGDQVLLSRESLFNRIATLTGGRTAEEVVFGSVTTGASNDIEQATKLARAMVTRFGMSEKYDMMGLETGNNAYLGGDNALTCSAETAAEIDREVLRIVKQAHEKARGILTTHRDILDEASTFLLQRETITGEEFMTIVRRHATIPAAER
ncbi:ATP-dependent metallopeptidase FtsH/Yme1/Tma family protein [uncultured Alistipes sp.]|uniref:ATP-dependent metallopeptidase FtsH/Yme1/Tma family protein n=1 Tax=uncultured Alistipes sp. TaxID=538949 RepID=UPI00260C044E|nr:FtsH/Yme1/Tma family ATP-dependent metallopeptidase [uncultured Alistipes sp.]